ncbi:Oxidase ucsJ [Psilocybe cubensis]|uniref:Oxidase ucsJ n=1 Tax=Psilocybe cubensis TaxID=181762 RepID=A0ACB8GXP9_PSICU|nr:Oxidase ucsJ [Psilocybe cubensis]KAH9480255.1 Oxidase ucsJ [Psilocybe cubensis]
MSPQINILITGATGYVGGSVLDRLLKHPEASSFKISAIVRSEEKGRKIENLGVESIIGSYEADDLSFLTDAASRADVVFAIVSGGYVLCIQLHRSSIPHKANSDHLPSARAILHGMKRKFKQSGKAPVLIHTSGTAIVMDDSRGLTSEHMIFSDLDVEKLNLLPETALHRNVDIPLIEADKEGFVKVYLITPGTIFGVPTGQLVDLGLQNTHSMQIPFIVKPSITRKQGGYIGKGLNTWSAISHEEVVDLYIILFDAIRNSPDNVAHGTEGYYFAENFEYSGIELARATSEALVELGIGSSSEPSAFTQEELDTFFGPIWPLLATNSYAKGDRSRALGWKPKCTKKEFLENVKFETKQLLAESK